MSTPRCGLIACIALLMTGAAVADAQQPDSTDAPEPAGIVKFLRPVLKPAGGAFVFLPKVTYASETSLGFGGELGKAFRWGEKGKESDSLVKIGGRYTLKNQGKASVRVDLGWGQRKYAFTTQVEFSNIPRRFYGVGPNTPQENEEIYQRQSLRAYGEVFRRFRPHFRLGLRAEMESSRMLETKPGGLLASGAYPGTTPEAVVGGGLLAVYDTRDARDNPRRGSYHQAYVLGFIPVKGSDYDFVAANLDLRWYLPVREREVLALQAFTYANDGDVPFWRLAAVGGRAHSRGYRLGRYLDEIMVAAQAEYRSPLVGRLGGVVFGGVAQAMESYASMADHWKWTGGGGLRLDLGSLVARGDVAYGNTFRFYLTIGHAF